MFPITQWKLGWFRNAPALRISEAMPLVSYSPCSRFYSLVFSFVCVSLHTTCFWSQHASHAAFVIRWTNGAQPQTSCVSNLQHQSRIDWSAPPKRGMIKEGSRLCCVGATLWRSWWVWPQWRSQMGGTCVCSGSHGGGRVRGLCVSFSDCLWSLATWVKAAGFFCLPRLTCSVFILHILNSFLF